MGVKRGQTVELDIVDVAFGGRGIARVEGFVVFVDGAVPGDRVVARIRRKRKQYAEAYALQVVKPSGDRQVAPCLYSGVCGGCKWQFLEYGRQLAYKRQHVQGSLDHIAGLADIPVHETLSAGRIFGYRNKMEFSCSDRRWLLKEELNRPEIKRDFALGLHVPGTFDKILDTRVCLLQPRAGNSILADIRNEIKTSGRPVYNLRSHIGFWRFIMLRHSVWLDRWMVNIITAAEDTEFLKALAGRLVERHPEVVSIVNNITSRKAAIAVGEKEILLAGDSSLQDQIGRNRFDISANSFFQTHSRGAEHLYSIAKDYAGLGGGETVLDLYTGTGTIAIALSDTASRVIGVELVQSAVEDAVRNCQQNNVNNCEFIQGDIRYAIKTIDTRVDVAVIDPPRAGMHEDVVAAVKGMGPERIVYVSCNPATLARDLSLLKDAYRILEVQPVDMFPHTFHVEAVAKLEKRV